VTVAERFLLHDIIFLYITEKKQKKTKRKANGTFTESSVVYCFNYIINVLLFSNNRFICYYHYYYEYHTTYVVSLVLH